MRLDQLVPELMEQNEAPGVSLSLVRGGEPVWSTAYGRADVSGGRPITVDAVYRVENF